MKKRLLLMCAVIAIAFCSNAQQWRQQNTNMNGTSTYVDQISIVDSNIAWVNGANGSGSGPLIKANARTNNGGETWVPGNYNGMPGTVAPRVLAASSYTTAFSIAMDTVSSVASFWKTTDGGANWSLVTGIMNASNTFANGVIFWNSNKGFCYGDPVGGKFDIYYTNDGGTTWTPTLAGNVTTPITGEYGFNGADCVAKAGGGVAAFITNNGRVYRTVDYGVHWDVTATAPFSTCVSNKIYMANANFMIVASMATSASTVYDWKYTTDGGATWNTYAATSGNFYSYQMAYVPGTSNMFVATSPFTTSQVGVAFANDGLNWVDYTDPIFLQDNSNANMQMLGVAFANQNNGWVGNYNYFGGYNSILRYQKNNATRFSVVATAIETNQADAGSVTGVGNYDAAASVTLTAVPNAGYVFEKWISYPAQTELGTNASYTFTMPTANVAVLASFVEDFNAGAYLSDLKVNGNTVSGFASTTFDYNVTLPSGTTVVPTILGTALDANATIAYVHPTTLPGVDSIKVTANDGVTKMVYRIIYSVANANDASLSDLKVSGTTVAGFTPSTYTYNVSLPFGTTVSPAILATSSDANATITYVHPTALPGADSVKVTAQDGISNQVYVINYTISAANNDASLSDLMLNGITVNGFTSSTYSYNVSLPFGTTVVPAITATSSDVNATITYVHPTSLPGVDSVKVTAQNGTTTQVYLINYSVIAASTNASLADLMVSGITVTGFAPTTYSYNVELPYGTTVAPFVSAVLAEENAIITYVHPTALPGADSVKVIAQDGITKQNYVINFTVLNAVAENDFGKVSVSPNPAANNVTIALDSKKTGVFNVNIVDVTGKAIYTNSLEANSTMNVDVAAFAKGVYFVKINNDKTQFVQKLIVK